jgi:secreted trypsin-like serine protease
MSRWHSLVFVLILVLPCAVAPSGAEASSAHTSVIGGSPAAAGQFPYLAFVRFQNAEEASACSGTLVSSNVVLTAAHCVMNVETGVIHRPERFVVYTGTTEWASSSRTTSAVSRVAIFPSFTRSGQFALYGDAAILQLSTPVASPPVTLSTSAPAPGTEGIVVGWGKLSAEQEGVSAQLAYGSTVVQSAGYCEGQIGSTFHPVGELCSLDYPTYQSATCNGDSGGPMLALRSGTSEYVQIGITSHGPENCPTDKPRVDTRADFVASWVNSRIAELAPPPPAAPVTPAPTKVAAPKTTPPPILARLTAKVAKTLTREALTDGLGSPFMHRRAYRVSCAEVESTKQKCSVGWWSGANDYWGSATIYYLLEGGKTVWNDRYSIKKVNDYCYWHSGHRASCPIRRFSR